MAAGCGDVGTVLALLSASPRGLTPGIGGCIFDANESSYIHRIQIHFDK